MYKNQINIRKIKSIEDLIKSREMCYNAFNKNIDNELCIEDSIDKILKHPYNRGTLNWRETIIVEQMPDNKIFAQVIPINYQINFNSQIANMVGVGAVSCIKKNTNAILECFKYFLKEAYDKDYEFSYLFPFSGKYYSKYGYSYCYSKYLWNFQLSSIKSIKDYEFNINELKFCNNFNIKFKNVFYKIVEQQKCYAEKYSFSVIRKDIDWFCYFNDDFSLIYNEKSYLIYNIENNIVSVIDWACNNSTELLALFSKFDKSIENIQINIPENFYINDIFIEMDLPSICPKAEIKSVGMARIVNLEKAFALHSCNCGNDFKFVFSITDSIINENNGTWCLIQKNNEISFFKTKQIPVKKYSINEITQLLVKGNGSSIFPYRNGGIFDMF